MQEMVQSESVNVKEGDTFGNKLLLLSSCEIPKHVK